MLKRKKSNLNWACLEPFPSALRRTKPGVRSAPEGRRPRTGHPGPTNWACRFLVLAPRREKRQASWHSTLALATPPQQLRLACFDIALGRQMQAEGLACRFERPMTGYYSESYYTKNQPLLGKPFPSRPFWALLSALPSALRLWWPLGLRLAPGGFSLPPFAFGARLGRAKVRRSAGHAQTVP